MKTLADRVPRPGLLLHGSGGEETAPGERETRFKQYDTAKQTLWNYGSRGFAFYSPRFFR